MNKKVVLLAFRGELMCFAHVLLHALDLHNKNYDVKVILEGSATGLIPDLNLPDKPFSDLYQKVKNAGLIDCVCKACAAKMKTLSDAQAQGLTINDTMNGHPSLEPYLGKGYQIVTF